MPAQDGIAEARRELEERLFALDAERDRLQATLRALDAQERLRAARAQPAPEGERVPSEAYFA